MDKIKNAPIKRSMTLTFIITICMIGAFSGIAILISQGLIPRSLLRKKLFCKVKR